jgi:hypothetical protein
MTPTYINQQLTDIGFTSTEITTFSNIIYDSIEKSKDIETAINTTGNIRFINALPLFCDVDWYYIVKNFKYGQ